MYLLHFASICILLLADESMLQVNICERSKHIQTVTCTFPDFVSLSVFKIPKRWIPDKEIQVFSQSVVCLVVPHVRAVGLIARKAMFLNLTFICLPGKTISFPVEKRRNSPHVMESASLRYRHNHLSTLAFLRIDWHDVKKFDDLGRRRGTQLVHRIHFLLGYGIPELPHSFPYL